MYETSFKLLTQGMYVCIKISICHLPDVQNICVFSLLRLVCGKKRGKGVARDVNIKIRDIGVKIRDWVGKREMTQKRRRKDDTINSKTVAMSLLPF